ncbi:MAG TPA: response regulator transcription factor [Acidimicrobiales bacterium]
MIRVAIVDDQPLVRAGFGAIISHVDDLELVGEADDGERALDVVRAQRPDVVLMDIRMPRLDGIEATRRITADRASDTKVIVLTTFDLDEYVYAALQAGASAFLLKDAAPEALVAAVRVVAGGDALLAPSVTRRLIERFAAAAPVDDSVLRHLTEREREVLTLVARGLTNAEIAEKLFVSAATAKTHVGRVLAKLHARDRAQLVVIAYESGLVRPGAP